MSETLFVSEQWTSHGGFTASIEGPGVDRQGNLYAVNFERNHTIGKVTPAGECSVFLELADGSVGNGIRFTQSGDMMIADYVNHQIIRVNMQTRQMSIHAHEPKMHQPNDICIADNDIIFASDPNWAESTGQMWRIDPDGTVTLLEGNMGTTNGIEVSPDGKTLYVNETVQRTIWAYDLTEDGRISNKRLLHQFEDFGLDGMRCDADGNVYVTRFGKGTIAKLSPAGEVLLEVSLHGKNCTNLTFGGSDGRTCYVTVSDTGSIERFRVDVPGRCFSMYQK